MAPATAEAARPAAGEAGAAGRRAEAWPLVLLAAVCLLVRVLPALHFGVEAADIAGYRRMAQVVLQGRNIYYQHLLFPYTPLSLYVPAACWLLAQALHLPFHFVMKWPAMLADLAITLLLYSLVRRTDGRRGRALGVALCYALNPVAILISAFHGNITPVAVAFALAAYAVALLPRDEGDLWLCALLVGLAVSFRSYPVLWLPWFLIKLPMSWRQRAAFAALAALPSALTSAPFLVASFGPVVREAFGYSAFPDYGWAALLRDAYTLQTGNWMRPDTAAQLRLSKGLFLAAYAALVLLAAARPKRFSLIGLLTTSTLLFYALYAGVGSQYLQWVLPFGLLSATAFALGYTWVATGALLGYYLSYFPVILWGRQPPPLPIEHRQALVLYLAMLVEFWLWCLLWLGRELAWRPGRAPRPPRLRLL